jgi:hypothetical protein
MVRPPSAKQIAGCAFPSGQTPACPCLTPVTQAQEWINVRSASSANTISLAGLFGSAFGTIAGNEYAEMTLLHGSNPSQMPSASANVLGVTYNPTNLQIATDSTNLVPVP